MVLKTFLSGLAFKNAKTAEEKFPSVSICPVAGYEYWEDYDKRTFSVNALTILFYFKLIVLFKLCITTFRRITKM